MKNFIKKYWSHILNIVFLLYCISILTFFANVKDNEITSIVIPIILIGIEAVLVIGVWIEIIYFMIKTIKNNEIKNKALSIVLIYLLNVFYIPCFALKHIYKDNKAKYKNAIYIIISILLYLLLTIVIFRFSLKEYNYTQYISDDNIISISVPSEYKNDELKKKSQPTLPDRVTKCQPHRLTLSQEPRICNRLMGSVIVSLFSVHTASG